MYEIGLKISNRKDIETILDQMQTIIDTYGFVTKADVYDLAGKDSPYEYSKVCWTDIRGIEVAKVEGGYVFVRVPNPLPSDDVQHPHNKDQNYESTDKMVSHPDHYQSTNGLEVIDAIEAFTDGLNGIEATDTGNIIKYACRWHKKNGIQDLEKILWYTQHLINHLKKKESTNHE